MSFVSYFSLPYCLPSVLLQVGIFHPKSSMFMCKLSSVTLTLCFKKLGL